MASKVTVIIPCKNERLNLRPCIETVRSFADEILVADSGSSDESLDIAKSLGCRIIEREYIHSGNFKNWAIPQATHPWVLILDADERVSPALAREIRQRVDDAEGRDGFWVLRNNYLLGHRVRRGGWGNDRLLRLFRRDHGRYVGETDHAEVSVDTGRVGVLSGRLDHYTSWTYEQCLRKIERYSTWQARVWAAQGRQLSLLRLVGNFPLRFFRSYVLHLGFLDGAIGFQVAMLTAHYSYMKQVRLWELRHAMRQPDPEAEHAAAAKSADSGNVERAA